MRIFQFFVLFGLASSMAWAGNGVKGGQPIRDRILFGKDYARKLFAAPYCKKYFTQENCDRMAAKLSLEIKWNESDADFRAEINGKDQPAFARTLDDTTTPIEVHVNADSKADFTYLDGVLTMAHEAGHGAICPQKDTKDCSANLITDDLVIKMLSEKDSSGKDLFSEILGFSEGKVKDTSFEKFRGVCENNVAAMQASLDQFKKEFKNSESCVQLHIYPGFAGDKSKVEDEMLLAMQDEMLRSSQWFQDYCTGGGICVETSHTSERYCAVYDVPCYANFVERLINIGSMATGGQLVPISLSNFLERAARHASTNITCDDHYAFTGAAIDATVVNSALRSSVGLLSDTPFMTAFCIATLSGKVQIGH
jgi:hypothetical protein